MTAFAGNDIPWAVRYSLPSPDYIQLTEPVELIEQALADESLSLKTWAFSVAVNLNITPVASGQWDVIEGRGYVWRVAFTAAEAHSLAATFNDVCLPEGDTLFVYNAERTIAYTYTAADKRRIMPTAAIDGQTLVIEWDMNKRPQSLPFTIADIGYGFRESTPKRARMRTSANCEVDINCADGNHWQIEKRSVVRLQTRNEKGVGLTCTGVLVNQNSDVKKNYLLTAGHCVSTQAMAERCVFMFNYEKETCGSSIAPNESQTLSGADLIAYRKELDFSLLETATPIPPAYQPYYAGWTHDGMTPLAGIGIHHPEGDVKKISIDSDPLTISTFSDKDLNCDHNAHWLVRSWNSGVTEQGSSGSPLFNEAHLVVGTLSGGSANCSEPINDYYSRFDHQWDSYNADTCSLSRWLDPKKTGVTILYGYDPTLGWERRYDTLTHISKNEELTLLKADEWGYLTGHNDKLWTAFAEKFTNDTLATIIGMTVNIADVYSRGSRVRFSVWSGAPVPTAEEWGADYVIKPEYRNYPYQIYFKQPLYLWNDFYVGFNIYYEGAVDTFAVRQSLRRPYAGISSLYVRDDAYRWTALAEEQPPTYASLAVKALGQFGRAKQQNDNTLSYKELRLVFQPGNDLLFAYMEMEKTSEKVKLECFDASGKIVTINEVGRNFVMPDAQIYLQMEISIAHLPAGLYILRASDRSHRWTGKFIKTK